MNIHIETLTKKYSGGFQALKGISLTIGKGMFGLLGPNGAGKTTLMKILATVQPHTSGRVEIGGLQLGRDDQEIRRILGYLPQEAGMYKKLTGYEYLDYVAIMKGLTDSRKRKLEVAELLERVNLSDKAHKRISGYSGGMKQRVGIAQALIGSPRVIVVDEPTAGLDPEERIRFRNLLAEMSAERIVLLSTHIVADIESSCEQLAIMRKGELLFHGSQEQLLSRAEGRVWSGVVADPVYEELKYTSSVKIISARKVPGGQELRVLSESQPFKAAQSSTVGLEDGYMSVMESGGGRS